MLQFEEKDQHNLTISYYPWVPWILLFMAAMLNLPHILWQSFASSSGLDLKKFINLADSHDSADNLAKILRIWHLKTNTVDRNAVISVKKFLGSLGLFHLGKHKKTYLCGLMILVKLFYFLVSVGLHLSLNAFIDENFLWYGFEVVGNFLKGIPQNSARFPKQTICDMKIRQMSNIHTYSIQCILPINLYNEKIFIFLWFWLPLLITVNIYSLLKLMFQLLSPARRWDFVEGYVAILFHLLKKRKSERKREKPGLNSSNSKQNSDIVSLGHASTDSAFSDHDPVAISDILEDYKSDTARTNNPVVKRTDNNSIRNLIFPKQNLHRRRHKAKIETDDGEIVNEERRKKVNRITAKMLKYFGHDGIVVFRILEHAVGIVIANEIFQELYEQLQEEDHHR